MSGYVLQAFQWQYAFERNVLPVSSDCHEFFALFQLKCLIRFVLIFCSFIGFKKENKACFC